jgi:uncharacterized protein (DUF983 family)
LVWKIQGVEAVKPPPRSAFLAMSRGLRRRCPACGCGRLFAGYVKTAAVCPHCGEALYHHRADDAPAYFTVFVTGHFVLGALISTEIAYKPPVWVHMVIFLPLTLIMSLMLLPVFKGAIIGLQWALYMHGFDPRAVTEELKTADGGGGR